MKDSQEQEQIVVEWGFSPRQTAALNALNEPQIQEVLYGGAKGGGKSYFGCRWCYLQALKIIDQFGLDTEQQHPIPVGYIGRKRGTDFTHTTLETWKKAIPAHLYRIRTQDHEIIIEEKVKLFYGGMDSEDNIAKFNSAEFAFIFIDQAEEITRTDLALLKGTLRLVNANETPDYKVLLTANPAPCFLRSDYIENPGPHKRFIQALPADNPYLPEHYVETLTQAFKHRPELVEAYVHGSWDELEESDILIKHKWVLDCVDNTIHMNNNKRVTVCDVARYGNDETVIFNMIDNKIVKEKIYGAKNTTITAGHIVAMAADNTSDLIAIDGDGMGGPVVDMVGPLLRNTDSRVKLMEIRSGKVADEDEKYVRSRSEMWFHAAKMLAEGECSIPNDPILIGQLTTVKYTPNGSRGRFDIEPKKETKKRLETSPDRADAFVYGLWATHKLPKKKFDYQRKDVSEVPAGNGYGWQQQAEIAYEGRWKY